jgi:IclR family acetate operon transcriptional repressor
MAKRQAEKPRPAAASRYRIQALDRAAAILNCFDTGHPELNVKDVADQTGLHKATAHRILMALQHNRLVEQDPFSGRYHLGLQLVKLGEQAVARLNLRDIARPFMTRLAVEVGETVHLAVMDGDQVVLLDNTGPQSSAAPSPPGRVFGAHAMSLGKAMLAELDDAAVERLLGTRALKRYTDRTHRTVAALIDDLKTVRKRGYATSDGEMDLGLISVGAVIRDHSGSVAAAISVAGPSSRLRPAMLAAVAAKLRKTADLISARLGYGPLALADVARPATRRTR